jgi:hypothetical protein
MKTRTIVIAAASAAVLALAATPAFAQSAAQAAYEAQLRAYEQQRSDYQRARENYDADLQRYRNDSADYDDVYAAPPDYVPAAYVPFDSLTPIRDQVLVSKPVQTLEGEYVGRVSDVRIMGGLITQMQVRINPARVTWANTARFRYDDVADVVVTDLTADQMAGRSRIDF